MVENSSISGFISPVYDCFPTMERYIDEALQKIVNKDPSTTKLILDDFHFPNVAWEEDNGMDAPTMVRMMEAATSAIQSSNNDTDKNIPSSPLRDFELRFVDLSSREVQKALLKLFQAKLDTGSRWRSVSFVGCYATPKAWSEILSPTLTQACDKLVLNHNSLPLQAFASLGNAMRTSTANLSTLHIQRETIQGDKAKAFFGDQTSKSNEIAPLCKVQELMLNFCRLDVPAVQALSRSYLRSNEKLQVLDLGACYLQDQQVFSIVNAVSDKPSLHTLVLTLNQCHMQGSLALHELLSSPLCRLRHLNLSHQKHQGRKLHMASVARGVASCPTLSYLNLSRNQLNAKDIEILVQCLEDKSSLTSLDLMSNPLGRQGLARVALSLPSALRELKRLNLTSTGTEDEGLENDADISTEIQQAMDNLALALVRGIDCNTSLEDVEFCRGEWVSRTSPTAKKNPQPTSSSSSSHVFSPQRNEIFGQSSIVEDRMQDRSDDQLFDLVKYYLVLNIGGRKLLSSSSATLEEKVPLGLWPIALERAQHNCFGARSESMVPDVIFHLLQQSPILTQPCPKDHFMVGAQMLIG
ncbi:leucine rich repeat LRR-containing protein [Nitzschia inconspicua]|uniref:Leucine rich repeat LRR-containing protein n=1 Tax=Nitzschia inconspicua TaxID=303405 RepID=A0A9K3Q727_9STRA|nr:leucine rich repeat LRR-containing protein [Nitzschia inconspicua]